MADPKIGLGIAGSAFAHPPGSSQVPGPTNDASNVVINDWGDITASVRTRKSGKERVSMEIRGEALLIELDPLRLARPIAEAFTRGMRNEIEGYSKPVKASTQRRREVARRAFDAGASWAKKQYSGGRIGPMAPNSAQPEGRWLNDSGRLARGILVRPTTRKEYVVNVAANRLTTPAVRSKVLPVLRDLARKVMASKELADAVKVSRGLVVQKRRSQYSDLFSKLKETLSAAQSLGGTVDNLSEDEQEQQPPTG